MKKPDRASYPADSATELVGTQPNFVITGMDRCVSGRFASTPEQSRQILVGFSTSCPLIGVHTMSVIKIIELVGESAVGWEDAMKQIIAEAQKTLRGITRIGVVEQDVRMINDQIDVWRVRAQVSFRVERPEHQQ
jgi:dodecin